MKLPEYVFLSHKDLPGGEVILQTQDPFIIARAFKFQSETELNHFVIKYNLHGSVGLIPGYNIIICGIGTIEEIKEVVALGHNVTTEALTILKNISTFYEKERIKGNETRLKKYSK